MTATDPVHETVNAVYVAESRRVLATLIRLLGDFDRAEEAMHEAFAAAVEQWPRDGLPANPRAWLVSAGRSRRLTAGAHGACSTGSTASATRLLPSETRPRGPTRKR